MAFLITFSVLLMNGMIWMGLFVWFLEVDNATLNAVAEWLSPERVSGWIFYLAISAACYVPLLTRFLRGTRDRSRQPDGPH